jgi:hypothetical protein
LLVFAEASNDTNTTITITAMTSTGASNAGAWFLKFPPFVYDNAAGLQSNFNRLASDRKWGKKLKRKRWVECQQEEFDYAFGTDTTKLEKWQELCRDVKIVEPPGSITQCKKVIIPQNLQVYVC